MNQFSRVGPGVFGTLNCDKNEFLLEDNPKLTKTTTLCFVLKTITREPIAEPLSSPGFIQLSADDYRLVLKRAEQ